MRTIRTITTAALLALGCLGANADPTGMIPQGASASKMRVNATNVSVRANATPDSQRVATLDNGRVLTVASRNGSWVQVMLDGGRTGWIAERYLSPVAPPSPAAAGSAQKTLGSLPPLPATAPPKPRAPAPVQPVPTQAAQPLASRAASQTAQTPAAAGPTKPTASFLDDAKPDPESRPKDSPVATLGGAVRMLLYLLPVLVLVVLGVRGLRMVQQRVGVAPTSGKGIIGGLIEANARRSGGSSIRVVESVPVGGVSLHLVEVRGKVLLLGATTASVSMLAEFEPAKLLPEDEFRAIMERARADMFAPDSAGSNTIAGSVGALDENLRKAREAIARGVARAKAA